MINENEAARENVLKIARCDLSGYDGEIFERFMDDFSRRYADISDLRFFMAGNTDLYALIKTRLDRLSDNVTNKLSETERPGNARVPWAEMTESFAEMAALAFIMYTVSYRKGMQ